MVRRDDDKCPFDRPHMLSGFTVIRRSVHWMRPVRFSLKIIFMRLEGQHVSLVCCCDPRVATRNLFGAMDSCVLFSLVFGGFLDLGEQRVLLAVGTCRARLLNTIALLCILGRGNKVGPARHRRLRVRTLCGHVNFVVGSGNPTNVRGKRGVRATKLNRNRTLGGQIRVLARSGECENVNRARLGRAILAVCVLVVE